METSIDGNSETQPVVTIINAIDQYAIAIDEVEQQVLGVIDQYIQQVIRVQNVFKQTYQGKDPYQGWQSGKIPTSGSLELEKQGSYHFFENGYVIDLAERKLEVNYGQANLKGFDALLLYQFDHQLSLANRPLKAPIDIQKVLEDFVRKSVLYKFKSRAGHCLYSYF